MKRVCAWCKKNMGDEPSQDCSYEITHGICDPCSDRMLSESGIGLHKFINEIEAPLLMMDREGTVVAANDKAGGLLGKPVSKIEKIKTGDVFECVNATLPGGCGKTINCGSCSVRRSITETYDTGESLVKAPVELQRRGDKPSEKTKFLVSTEKVGEAVFVRVDKMDGPDK